MIANISTGIGGLAAVLVVVAIYAFVLALIIICLIRVSRYFMTAGKEQKLIRMELGKLAEEVHLLWQEIKNAKGTNTPPQII